MQLPLSEPGDGLDAVRNSPADEGRLELIARRPAAGVRELLESGVLDPREGLVGDRWSRDSNSSGRGPNPDAQVTIMNSRLAALVAGGDEHDRWALAGDQLYVDLNLSHANLPAGTQLVIGADALLEVTAEPHLGCGKFLRRFGTGAMKLVNSKVGRAMRFRGLNARVVEPGAIASGDAVRKLS